MPNVNGQARRRAFFDEMRRQLRAVADTYPMPAAGRIFLKEQEKRTMAGTSNTRWFASTDAQIAGEINRYEFDIFMPGSERQEWMLEVRATEMPSRKVLRLRGYASVDEAREEAFNIMNLFFLTREAESKPPTSTP